MTAADRAFSAVKALLDTQREALLTGDLERLAHMPDRLARALQSLLAHPPPQSMLDHLALIAGRNAHLISSAQRGIAETRARSTERGAQVLTTYDARGHQKPTVHDDKIVSRR